MSVRRLGNVAIMAGAFSSAVHLAVEKYARKCSRRILYGTAGFRETAEVLDHVMYRVGLLAVLRSQYKNATVGVMITASHNPEPDNGVKLVDPLGEMLETSWEVLATDLVNVEDDALDQVLSDIVRKNDIDVSKPASVFLGRDTRSSSVLLAEGVSAGVKVLQGNLRDYGVITTPMTHYFVTCHNTRGDYGQPSREGYYDKLVGAFRQLAEKGEAPASGDYVPWIKFDGANGVGALVMKDMLPKLKQVLNVDICNDGTSGQLNHQCGADYVKVQQKAPEGMEIEPRMRCVSVDGDADRVIYFYHDEEGKFHMLDGDKIATLFAAYLVDLVRRSQLDLGLGLVQTAYANGSSTKYITKVLKMSVACVPTGVKHLHHRALEFDIGIYFEANGHGTVIFSKKAEEMVRSAANDSRRDADAQKAASELSLAIDVINQTVGDAISDILLVETVLRCKGWSAEDWTATYTDLPNRQLKVKVADRTAIKTTDAERKCVSPDGLQEKIDRFVNQSKEGRAFVRPSGTEDIVRVYAEADTQKNADKLAHQVALAVFQLAGGIGALPSSPC